MGTVGMNQETAKYSFWEAIGADDLVASEIRETSLEYEDAFPFDRIGTDSDISDIFWEKTFPSEMFGLMTFPSPFPFHLAYLRALMPELYGVHPSSDRVLVMWVTRDVHAVLSETLDSMSPTTKALLAGTTTLKETLQDFFTPAIIEKISTLRQSTKGLHADEIIRILMNGESVALAVGTL